MNGSDKMEDFICKIASLEEMNEKWDYEIENATDDKENWIKWKESNMENFIAGYIIPYYGILKGKIICEATAHLNPVTVQNSESLVSDKRVYLSAFRTNIEYQGKGYFSKLLKYMLNDLKNKGYEYVTLGVEPEEEKNKLIYNHYGFNKHIKNDNEIYPDGTVIEVEYYEKKL